LKADEDVPHHGGRGIAAIPKILNDLVSDKGAVYAKEKEPIDMLAWWCGAY
jgi:hypothetical protein